MLPSCRAVASRWKPLQLRQVASPTIRTAGPWQVDDLAFVELSAQIVERDKSTVGAAALPERPAVRLGNVPSREWSSDRVAGNTAGGREGIVGLPVEHDPGDALDPGREADTTIVMLYRERDPDLTRFDQLVERHVAPRRPNADGLGCGSRRALRGARRFRGPGHVDYIGIRGAHDREVECRPQPAEARPDLRWTEPRRLRPEEADQGGIGLRSEQAYRCVADLAVDEVGLPPSAFASMNRRGVRRRIRA